MRTGFGGKFLLARTIYQQGFTILEMLVAMTVLAILVLMIAGLMNNASTTVTGSAKFLSADDQARQVFDRMQMDFARMVKRSDVYFNFLKATGSSTNDQFSFYSETPGFFSNSSTSVESNLSLVSYQCTNGILNGQFSCQLERLGQGYQWSDITFSGATQPSNFDTSITSNPDFHVLSNSVFRMEFAFLISQGNNTFQITATPPQPGPGAFKGFYAVIVALGVLDAGSQKLLPQGNNPFPTLIQSLPHFSGVQTLPQGGPPDSSDIDPILSTWHTEVNKPTFASDAGISIAVAQQVRIYQRIFYLQ